MKHPFLTIVYDDTDRKYYVHRRDCPGREWKPITLGAAIQISKDVNHYQWDGWNAENER